MPQCGKEATQGFHPRQEAALDLRRRGWQSPLPEGARVSARPVDEETPCLQH